jgi:hypothetical protein
LTGVDTLTPTLVDPVAAIIDHVEVVAAPAPHPVGSGAAIETVVAVLTLEPVVGLVTMEPVVAPAAGHRHGSRLVDRDEHLAFGVAALAVRHRVGEGRLAGEAGFRREGDGPITVENSRPVLVFVKLDDREHSTVEVDIVDEELSGRQAEHFSLPDREAVVSDDGLLVVQTLIVLRIILHVMAVVITVLPDDRISLAHVGDRMRAALESNRAVSVRRLGVIGDCETRCQLNHVLRSQRTDDGIVASVDLNTIRCADCSH